MIAEAGLFCLILALISSAFQFLLPLMHPGQTYPTFYAAQRGAAMGQFLCVTIAFYALIYSFVISDFSLVVVAANSHSAKPMLYKFTASWGNHEGSILLWAWVLALCGFLLARRKSNTDEVPLIGAALAAQGIISMGTLLFILMTSNPFARQFPQPAEGRGLNPLLQDIGLALHPPMLYMGYVGFSVVFSLAVAAMLTGKIDKNWAKLAHPWIMFSWSFLTLGIGLGSWWAYRELGWGGWWFWDPVENASLLPWLAGTALLHSNLVLAKRGMLQRWVLLLAIITFSLSLLGTFLVRSGLLTSVHAFASDPTRGMFILAYITFITGAALWLYATRSVTTAEARLQNIMSREGGIVLNNLFLVTGCATILLATSYPLITQAIGAGTVSIGPPYYEATFIPLMMPVVLLAALAPFLPWKTAPRSRKNLKYLHPAWIASLVAAAIVLYIQTPHMLPSAMGVALATWLGTSNIAALAERAKLFRIPFIQSIRRLREQPAAFYAMIGAHSALALLVAGITASTLWQRELAVDMQPGDNVEFSGYNITYQKKESVQGKNYRAQRILFDLQSTEGDKHLSLMPELRYYPVQGSTTSEAHIYSTPVYDFYAVTGNTQNDDREDVVTARFYFTPLMWAVWGGCLLMTGAGFLSLITSMKGKRRLYG